MTEACDLPATTARALIGRKALAASELLESCIARIEAVDDAVNAMVIRDFDRARAAARAADAAVMRGDALGALHGLPMAVKDTEDVEGLPTTYGSPIFRDSVAPADQGSVARIRAAGAVIIGKTNVPEFAAGANTRNAVFGVTANPFDVTRSAAGSSGGSAVALATGMTALATGSDLGGSLRNPAAFCGVVGLRPSPGRVPDEGRLHAWSPLAVLGPMGRSVGDAALLLSVMQAADVDDPLSGPVDPVFPVPRVDVSALRVAFSADLGFAPVEAHVARVFAVKAAVIRPVFAAAADAAPDCSGADDAFAVLRAVGMLASHADKVRDRPGDVGPNVTANVAEGHGYGALDVARALTAHTALQRRWGAFFRDYDLLVTPAITVSPRPWAEAFPAQIDGMPTRSYYHWLALAYGVTLSGHPAIAIPAGRDEAGLPFGLQVVGRRGGEAALLGAALALEAVLAQDPATARPVPDIAALRNAERLRLSPS